MQTYKKLIVLIVLATGLSAQEAPVPTNAKNAGQQMPKRDKIKENEVAKLFDTIRSDSKASKLTRIKHRSSLEQRVCTIALEGSLPRQQTWFAYGFYQTAHPESISAELNKVASFDKPGFPRYSIAVWRVEDSQGGDPMYWVGVERYWSAVAEFVDYNFTDDVFYHNEWKKSVAPQCRGK